MGNPRCIFRSHGTGQAAGPQTWLYKRQVPDQRWLPPAQHAGLHKPAKQNPLATPSPYILAISTPASRSLHVQVGKGVVCNPVRVCSEGLLS